MIVDEPRMGRPDTAGDKEVKPSFVVMNSALARPRPVAGWQARLSRTPTPTPPRPASPLRKLTAAASHPPSHLPAPPLPPQYGAALVLALVSALSSVEVGLETQVALLPKETLEFFANPNNLDNLPPGAIIPVRCGGRGLVFHGLFCASPFEGGARRQRLE